MKTLGACLLAIVLAGCAGTPGGNFIGANTEMDAGQLPADYKAQTETLVRSRLRDPYTAMIQVGEGFRSSCLIGIYGRFYGWAVPVLYNAKNGFGGYVGERGGYVWFANGRPTRASDAERFCP